MYWQINNLHILLLNTLVVQNLDYNLTQMQISYLGQASLEWKFLLEESFVYAKSMLNIYDV